MTRKRSGFSIILILTGVLNVAAMSREEMMEHAFRHSEKLEQVELERLKVESLRKEYTAKGFPEINADLNYLYQPRAYSPFDFGPFPSVSEMMDPTEPGFGNSARLAGTMDQLFSSLDLSPRKQAFKWEVNAVQPIFAQGKIFTGVQLAGLYGQLISHQREQVQFDLAEQVSHTYFLALVAEENVRIREGALELAEEAHAIAVRRFDVGQGNQLDTLNSRYTLQQEIYQLQEARKNRRLANHKLLTTISLEMDPDSLVLSDTLSRPPLSMTFAQAREQMLQNNSILKTLRKGKQIQEKQTALTRTDYFPTVYAGMSLGQTSQHDEIRDMDLSRDSWDVKFFTGINVPIWNGGQRRHRMTQAVKEELQVASQIKEAEDLLTLKLSAAFEEYQLALENLAATNELLTLARRGLSVAERAFTVGQTTQLELNQNQQNYNMSRLAYTDALHQLTSAYTTIQKLIGNPQLILNQ
ncbi:TolC family protein [Chitinispirillales bacterium ANBcel5]|uniref:TolC family protein n=1 Tax=Cellulosispirillum alkaliphilum TaxID=3039283 RepID=UPI002A559DEB|nr:TolC family protein [Chitinispirillales bacterium ANBcel5]